MTSSSVLVQGGLLLGSGQINNNVTLSSGGVAGTLAIGGNLTVTGNSTWYAQNTVSGGATVQGGLFTLASGASLTAPTLNVTGGAIAAADCTGTLNGSLNYTSSTNSTFAGTIAGPGQHADAEQRLGHAGTFRAEHLRRRDDHQCRYPLCRCAEYALAQFQRAGFRWDAGRHELAAVDLFALRRHCRHAEPGDRQPLDDQQ